MTRQEKTYLSTNPFLESEKEKLQVAINEFEGKLESSPNDTYLRSRLTALYAELQEVETKLLETAVEKPMPEASNPFYEDAEAGNPCCKEG